MVVIKRRFPAVEKTRIEPMDGRRTDQRMKLLFVHQHLGALGGAEANILLSARELRRQGHQLALLYDSATGKDEHAWREIFSDCFPMAPQDNRTRVAEVLTQVQPDLVYLHKLKDLEVMEQLIQWGPPAVRMVHDHDLYCMRSYKYNYFTRRICKRRASLYCVFPCLGCITRNRQGGFPVKWESYRARRKEIRLNQRCRRLVAYSEYAKQELVRNGFDGRKIDILVPIHCEQQVELSSLNSRNLILYAGQIIRGKGVDLLLHALAGIRETFECIIVGEGNHRRHCERLCRQLGLQERVRFQGFVPQEDLKRYYLEASVFTISSVWPEPFGMVGPEAMRYGVPVVGFDAGGVGEWLIDGENGFLVPWADTNLFASRVEQLLRDKRLARQYGLAGQERVHRCYESGQQIKRLETMFQGVISETQSTQPKLSNSMTLCAVTG